jgi:hypothetical protein
MGEEFGEVVLMYLLAEGVGRCWRGLAAVKVEGREKVTH